MENIRDFFVALFTDISAYFQEAPGFGGPITSGQMIIWAIALGFVACAIGAYLTRLFLGKFVLEILDKKAESSETAVQIQANFFVKHSLRSKGAFSKIVQVTDDEKYYIEPKNISRAENLYAKNGANPISLAVTLILIVALAAFAYAVIPELLEMSAGFAESIKPESNIA